MTFYQLGQLVRSDLFRYYGACSYKEFLKGYLKHPGFRYTFYLRFGEYCHDKSFLRYLIYPFVKLIHKRLTFRYGISIPIGTDIGYGLYIGHFGGIVINGKAVIGNNCNLSQGVTLGEIPFGDNAGSPVIGDSVYLAPGSKVIGGIQVSNFSIIAPNSVLHRSIDQHSVVSGIPANVVSTNGSRGYIKNPYVALQNSNQKSN